MREDLLHFIWKYKKLPRNDLRTSRNESVAIIDVGLHNHRAGPDFFNAKIKIQEQLWAGNIEIHIRSSDWYIHGHEDDANYDNVILHVVWEDDVVIFRKDGTEIPALELKNLIPNDLLNRYQNLFDNRKKTFINCEKDISKIETFTFQNWLERLYFERLEKKSEHIQVLLKDSKNDWEHVLFSLLLQNFGLKINRESFFSLSSNLPYSVIRKLGSNIAQLESIFFGMSHLLDDESILDAHYVELKREYQFLRNKFDLNTLGVLRPEFFKLRPSNFPTIRLSQLANLYGMHENLFDKVIASNSVRELYTLFNVSASSYWDDHFTFGKRSKKSRKRVSKGFMDLLIINTILPLKFCYSRQIGQDRADDVSAIILTIRYEQNSIISNFKKNNVDAKSAMDSQALIQLYNTYCTKNRCLLCVVGSTLLQGNV